MKKILFVAILIVSSVFSFAGVIMTTNNERIEDVSIQSEIDSAIVYLQDGVEKSIAIKQVSAILYDDGTYKEIYQPKATGLLNSFSPDTITHVVPDSLQITSMFGLALNPDVMKLAFDPAFAQYSKAVWEEAQIEYELIFSSEIAKGNSKKNAKKIAKHVRDSINTVKLMEYVSMYSTK